MISKQNRIVVFVFAIFLFLFSSFYFLNQAKANVITVDDPTGDDVDNGFCSIVEAIINHNGGDQSGSIDCAAGIGESDVISIETDITLDSVYALDGDSTGYGTPGTKNIIINGNGHTIERDELSASFRIFRFSGFGDVEINDLTIKGGDVDGSGLGFGGAIHVSNLDVFELNDVIFEDNIATEGGAIFVSVDSSPAVNFYLNNSTFTNNSAATSGGAIRLKNNSNNLNVSIDNSTFDTNASSSIGGAIYGFNVTELSISETDFTSNSATANGSNIYIENGANIDILQTNFSGGSSGDLYGTYFINSDVTFTESFFSSSNVGAIFVEDSDILIDKTSFDRRTAGIDGGALYATNSNIDIINSTFRRGLAFGGGGGALYLDATNTLNLSYSTFLENNTGGGVGGDIATGGIQTSGVIENNIFISTGYNDICYGDFTNFTFLNNLYSHDDSDCGITANPTTNYGNVYENGGNVETVPLLSGSNAIDTGVAGTLGCPETDARGVERPFGAACDIGAYEYTGDVAIDITETDGSTLIAEPNTNDTYTISLGKFPTSSVTVDLTKSDDDFFVSPSSVTFTTSNWLTPQTITVSPDDNSLQDGERTRTITHSVTSSDPDYAAVTPNPVSVTISDNDTGSTTTGSGGGPGGGGGPSNPPPVEVDEGCTDNTALNYDPSATVSDDSCEYFTPVFFGCKDVNATNYDVRVTIDDGSCSYPPPVVYGCTNSTATNYNPLANTSDGSCIYPVVLVYGCIDSNASNYNPLADTSDGSCAYPVVEVPESEPEPEEPIVIVTPDYPEPIDPEIKTMGEYLGAVLGGFIKDAQSLLVNILDIVSEDSLQDAALVGVFLPAILFIVTQPGAAASIPLRIWSLVPSLLGIKRKKRPWGTVYDSVTKQPLDPVHLVLQDEGGKQVATAISDLDGRFGFIVPPGRYKIFAKKDNYKFPSTALFGKQKDSLYENLYFNEFIDIQNEDDLLIKNIPMDSLNFNWNEFSKSKNMKLMKFYSKTDLFLSSISNIVFVLGTLVSLLLVFISPNILNFAILGIYYVILFLRMFGIGPKKPGHVIDSETKNPLSFGLVTIFSTSLNREMGHSIISKTGKYYILVPNGEYYAKIYQKTGEDSYEHVFTSDSFKIHKGYLGKIFKV